MPAADAGLHLVSAPREGARPASFWRVPDAPPPGKGRTPVLALGGIGLDGRVFARLAPLAAERDLVLANLPNDLPHRSRMEDMGREALAILDAAGHAGRPAILLGSSFGGMAALAAALAAPVRAAALVLLGTARGWPSVPFRLRAASRLHPLVPRRPYPGVFAGVMLPPHRWIDPALREELRVQMLHRTKGFVGATIHAMRGFDAGPRLGGLACPALVVHGSRDGVFPVRAGAALASGLAKGTLVVVHGAGHLPHVSHPAEVLDAIRGFLAREGL